MKNYLWAGLAVVVILLAGWFYFAEPKEATGEPVKVGAMFALTGYAAFAGEASRDGFLMALEDSGLTVNSVVEDFRSDTKTVVSVAQKLINIDKVAVVIGPEWAEFGEAVTPLANENKIVFVSPWMVSEDKLAPPYYFTATPSDRIKQAKLIEYMVEQGHKNIVLAYSENSWSVSGIQTFKEELEKNGQMEVVSEYRFAPSQTDYRTDIAKIKTDNPDAIYSLVATDDSHGLFAKQMQEQGLRYPMYIDISRAESPVAREQYGEYIAGSIYPASKEFKNASAFEEKFEKRFGRKPGALSAATAYDMTTLVLNAIKAGAESSDEIQEYLTNVKNYEGYSNFITFNEQGQVASESVVIKQATLEGSEVIAE